MCVSNNFIEQQAYEYSEKIRKNSLYKFVRTDLAESHSNAKNGASENELALVTKVILEDKDGTLYYVVPNLYGLKFAKKEITYKEYKKLQSKETRNAIFAFLGILGFFSPAVVFLMKYFT